MKPFQGTLRLLVPVCLAWVTLFTLPFSHAGQFTVAVIPKAINNPVFLDTKAGAQKAARELGIKLLWTGSLESVAEEQAKIIEGLILMKVDAMLISCNDSESLDHVIDKARNSGIYVATFDSDAPSSRRQFHIGIDNYEVARRGGEEMVRLARIIDGQVNITLLSGVPGAANLDERIRGFRDGVSGSNIRVGQVLYCNDNIEQAVELVNQEVAINPDLGGFFFIGGWPFFAPNRKLGVLKAMVEEGKLVVSMDNFYPMLTYLERGYVQFLIGNSFYDMGYEGLYRLIDLKNGKAVPEKIMLDSTNEITTLENIDDIREKKLPWN